jgi:hypothetical protein
MFRLFLKKNMLYSHRFRFYLGHLNTLYTSTQVHSYSLSPVGAEQLIHPVKAWDLNLVPLSGSDSPDLDGNSRVVGVYDCDHGKYVGDELLLALRDDTNSRSSSLVLAIPHRVGLCLTSGGTTSWSRVLLNRVFRI